ncbi:MAG: hypothetical protein AAGJ93_03655 [Bacteroidota bacterium]
MRGYKGAATKRIKNIARNYAESGMNIPPIHIDQTTSIWQRDYYDVIIRNEQMHKNITNYIHHHPENWKTNQLQSLL